MNFLNKKWLKFKNKNIRIEKVGNSLKLINDTDYHGFFVCPSIKTDKIKNISVEFGGEILKGNGAVFQILNFKRDILCETSFNAKSLYEVDSKKYFFCIKIYGHSEVIINRMNVEFANDETDQLENICKNIYNSNNDILIVTPSYPTEENKYFGGFVHSRVKAYKEVGMKFDLVCAHSYNNTCEYSFEGINVIRTKFKGLRDILTKKKYKTILLHFFDSNYAKILDGCDLTDTQLFLWIHGPETLYWDWSKMTDNYFTVEKGLSAETEAFFKSNDELINRYNNYDNVHWIFVSNWIKERSEELINIKFKNYSVIPNFIDSDNFNYVEKDVELRKNIFFLRRFENISKYAIDVNVRTILELSRREFFNDLQFNIYGTGDFYDTLLNPIKKFSNVHLYPKFLNHTDIANVHKENGIGLFATRYDAQGVSMCEAAMSGLVIVSSKNDAIAEFIPNNEGLLCGTENYVEYADQIERLYKNPELFKELSQKCHDKVYSKCNFSETIQKEIDLIKNANEIHNDFEIKIENKILTIIVPAYNVGVYLKHGVHTMLKHKNANKIQVVIVNDGSKDNTLEVSKELQKIYGESNITVINKPNGGHGSTINEGLKVANGKYVRMIDGDDWVNSNDLEKLIDILENETSDIILTDYCEDRAYTNDLIPKRLYEFMIQGKAYNFDDLCYEGYGFAEWGPILATANIRTELLKNKVKLSEKCFYVDMEFDTYVIADAKTVTHYNLDIYRYFIGRSNQSISKQSYIRNFKQHEKILFNIVNYWKGNKELSDGKRQYIYNKIIIPMLTAQYTILIQFLRSGKEYRAFEKELEEYPELYNETKVITRMKRFHRKTNGIFVRYDDLIKRIFFKIFKF